MQILEKDILAIVC